MLSLGTAGRKDFNDWLVDSVDETIREVLGAETTSNLWHHFQTTLGITREEIPYRLPTLFQYLNAKFGIGGAGLNLVIVKKLYSKAKVPLNYEPSRPLTEYIEELKQILARKDP